MKFAEETDKGLSENALGTAGKELDKISASTAAKPGKKQKSPDTGDYAKPAESMEAGMYSLRINFPKTGTRYDFKKLKADAELKISFRDVSFSRKLATWLLYFALAASLFLLHRLNLLTRPFSKLRDRK